MRTRRLLFVTALVTLAAANTAAQDKSFPSTENLVVDGLEISGFYK